MFDRIPLELRTFKQWVNWRLEEVDGAAKPTKVPYSPLTGGLAATNNPDTWASFDQAVAAMQTGWYSGIGFMLSEADPYTFIDLDDPFEVLPNGQYKNEDPKLVFDRQQEIYSNSNSYAELSPSGKGLHIIVRGSVPSGRKRGSIEVYSTGRYMTMTGNVYRDAPIIDGNALVNGLHQMLGAGKAAENVFAGAEYAKYTDEKILEIASQAANAEKFNDLYYQGNWQKYYPSQSEADFALVDILAFYSENRAQVKKLFLESKLGQREKSRADYRISYMLNRCFDRMLPPPDIEGLRMQIEEELEKKKVKPQHGIPTTPVNVKPIAELPPSEAIYRPPPGLVGELAQFIYAQSPRPVPEIALAGALGLMAGIVGRAYNISGTGLNQYVLLLAATGTGKEAIASGIDKLMASVIKTVPAATDFVGPGEIASSQAMIKYMSKTANSFVSTVGEFGLYLQQMASINAPPHLMGLRRLLLDLYNKSGEGKVLRPSIYSDREKNTASVYAPAFTLLGESTPEKFYEGLHEGMISEGLLPRFLMIEYHGARPPLNEGHMFAMPSFDLTEKLATVCANALQLNSQHKAIHVILDADSESLFANYNVHCDLQINASDREVRKHLWNRAHIKALKLAALVAVGVNPYDPKITADIAKWAIDLVTADVRNMLGRFDAGEIGIDNDETKQIAKVMEAVKEYVVLPWDEAKKYSSSPMALHADKVIPYSYLSRKLISVAVFRKDKIGASKAIERAVKTICERGDMAEVPRAELQKKYGTYAKSFAITSLKAFGL